MQIQKGHSHPDFKQVTSAPCLSLSAWRGPVAVPTQETIVKKKGCDEALGVALGMQQMHGPYQASSGVVDDIGVLCG